MNMKALMHLEIYFILHYRRMRSQRGQPHIQQGIKKTQHITEHIMKGKKMSTHNLISP